MYKLARIVFALGLALILGFSLSHTRSLPIRSKGIMYESA